VGLQQGFEAGEMGFKDQFALPNLDYDRRSAPVRALWDIGGAGAQADAMAIWIVQWVGQTIRVLDYIEGVGQVLAYYVNELRRRKYHAAVCYLPHDGINANNVTGKRYSDHLAEAGFETVVIPNQGRGAAMMRIEAVRRIMPKCWFNAETTEAGRDALGYSHERRDEIRSLGLGPEHDWSSNSADAFGLMAICYQGPDDPMTVDSLFERERGSYSIHATRSEITGY
jgi:phage terminase large subunit